MYEAILLIIRRSWVRAPPAPPAVLIPVVGEPWTGLYTDVGGAMFEPSGRIWSHRVAVERADVLAAIDRIRRYVQDDRTPFDTDELLQSAVLHWIEIIGEAARGVGDKVRTAHPEVPWRVITDMRNRVSHGYFDIDLDVVWNTVTRDLPKLQESVTRILAELDSEAEDSR
jgi:uncharacterized protein with HEPN domain